MSLEKKEGRKLKSREAVEFGRRQARGWWDRDVDDSGTLRDEILE